MQQVTEWNCWARYSSTSESVHYGSTKSAEWMRSHVLGDAIPSSIIRRLAGPEDQKLESRKLGVEPIQGMREIKVVSGST